MIVITFVLAGVALWTALRLYTLRTTPITPVAPGDSSASSQNNLTECQVLVINLGGSPSPSPSTSPSGSPSTSPSVSPSPSSSASANPSVSPSPSASPNPSSSSTASSTPRPSSSSTVQATSTPTVVQTQEELPNAGVSMPTILGVSAAVILLLGAALLAI